MDHYAFIHPAKILFSQLKSPELNYFNPIVDKYQRIHQNNDESQTSKLHVQLHVHIPD